MSESFALLRGALAVVLCAWLGALMFAAVKLDTWNGDAMRALMQIRDDATYRERMAQQHEVIPREWYRSHALALLASGNKLNDDAAWALVIPGSWQIFDSLRSRVALRVERAFADVATQAVRRELHFRAHQLTGVPLDEETAELAPGQDCASPPFASDVPLRPGPVSPDLPQASVVREHLAAIAQLDLATQAMTALQEPGLADAQHLRLLVRYTLGVELPPRWARSFAALFRRALKPADSAQGGTDAARLQQALRCSARKTLAALDTRQ